MMAKGWRSGSIRRASNSSRFPTSTDTPTGELVPVLSTVWGTNTQVPLEWGAVLQQVEYGDAAREKAIGEVLSQAEQVCGPNGVGTTAQKVVNSIFRITLYLSMLALVKNSGFQSEREWRITIPEHFGSFSMSLMTALSQVEGYQYYGQGPLMTLNVLFREGGRAALKPYTVIPFEKSALVKVVIGPNVDDAESARLAARRLLDRYGFRHTEVVPSEQSYRTYKGLARPRRARAGRTWAGRDERAIRFHS